MAFVTIKGAQQLIQWIDEFQLHIPIKLLVGTYLDFTDPSALEILNKNSIDLKVYPNHKGKLHAKAYFLNTNNLNYLIIGSSNLTHGALLGNIEWNALITLTDSSNEYIEAKNQYSKLWNEAIYIDQKWIDDYRIIYDYSGHICHELI